MPERKGQYTVLMSSRPTILGYAAVVGKKEGEGPLGRYFDYIFEDTTLGEKTWEKAESAFQREAFTRALDKAGLSPSQIHYLFAGDLLNQNIASTFGMRESNVPLLGQFGACSTMAQTLGMAAVFVDSGAADLCSAVTSSHFCTAERQFRFPLEYGGPAHPYRPMDRHRLRLRRGGDGGQRGAYRRGLLRPNQRPGHHRRQQYGRGYGAGCGGHHRQLPHGYRHHARRTMI